MRLKNKNVVITGAGQGIGAAIARRLYKDGAANIALIDINEEKLVKVIESLQGEIKQGKIKAYTCNVASRDEVAETFDMIYSDFGKVDVLVNNAGITRDSMFHKMSEENWDIVLDVNLKGVYNCCKNVVAKMREQNYGKIVNMTSVSAFGNMGQTNYAASKAGVIGFTKSLAKEIARNNCTVNAIAPSYVNTEMLQAVPEKVLNKFIASIPMNRLAEPEELASVVSFLSSDDSSFVTGECIVVSGGSHT